MAVDVIYRIDLSKDTSEMETEVLYAGDLNFDPDHPIQAVADYEAALVQKVYWVDGLNRPRLINIAKPELKDAEYDETFMDEMSIRIGYSDIYNDAPFDFIPDLSLNEEVSITRVTNVSGGLFPACAIQYAFTYSFKYGQETNMFYQSPLMYASHADRGGAADSSVYCAFRIVVSNVESDRFDFLNIYSIQRTSINGTPVVQRIAQIDLADADEDSAITFVDTNTTGEDVDSSYLQYIGGNDIIANCVELKDGTLFLGDLTYNRPNIKEVVGDSPATEWASSHRLVQIEGNSSVNANYQWQNQLGYNTSFFKGGETYRFGFQAQYKTGEWSEPIWLEDREVNLALRPYVDANENSYNLYLPQIACTLTDETVNQALLDAGYIKIRPLVVFPSEYERSIIAQGIINGTVFQSQCRNQNAPFAFGSWFFRLMGSTPTKAYENTGLLGSVVQWQHLFPLTSGRSSGMEIQNTAFAQPSDYEEINSSSNTLYNYNRPWSVYTTGGIVARSSDSATSAKNAFHGCESYTLSFARAYLDDCSGANNTWFVDNSICTFHSPDIAFDDTMYDLINSSSNIRIRVCGLVEFDACLSNIDIDLDSVQADPDLEGLTTTSMVNSTSGARGLVSGLFFRDGTLNDSNGGNTIELCRYAESSKSYTRGTRSWLVCPWHRSGSLNNDIVRSDDGGTRTAVLKTKCLSNCRIANDTFFFSTVTLDDDTSTVSENEYLSASLFKVFDSDDVSLIKLIDDYNELGDIIYYGNVDFLAISPGGFNFVTGKMGPYSSSKYTSDDLSYTDPASSSDGTSFSFYPAFEFQYGEYLRYLVKYSYGDNHAYVGYGSNKVSKDCSAEVIGDYKTALYRPREGCRIKYKTTPHVVFAFDYVDSGRQRVNIPLYAKQSSSSITHTSGSITSVNAKDQFWLSNASSLGGNVYYYTIKVGSSLWANDRAPSSTQAYTWLCELVQDNVTNKFGGSSSEALMRNIWVAAGEPVDITSTSTTMYYQYGDTWYQRYDCLKTYPYSSDDTNQVVEIGSFMCETHRNIDGRTDRNRGLVDNTTVSPENFNLINDIYSQQNNFFTYQIMDDDYYKVTRFPNQMFYTETKTPASTIDNCTRLHMATTIDFDGSSGALTSIVSAGDMLVALQDRAVSLINFNSLAVVNTETGVPIAIGNASKITEPAFSAISTTVGCQDKFAVCVTSYGLYFVDNHNHALFRLSDDKKLENVSGDRLMRFWFNDNKWNITWRQLPYDTENDGKVNGLRLYWDSHFNDVYIVPGMDKDSDGSIAVREALVYSDLLQEFTSQMTYGGSMLFSHGGRFYGLAYQNEGYDANGDQYIGEFDLWECFPDDLISHNYIFGKYYPFSLTFIANEDNIYDKVFDTVEMRADSYIPGSSDMALEGSLWDIDDQDGQPFDYIRVRNEYQDTGTTSATAKSFRKKFRVWRYTIPREKDSRARIRNMWAMITLGKADPEEDFTILHDLLLTYTPF